jgi:hypothetical protein
MRRNELQMLKENLMALRNEKEKLSKSIKKDHESMDELGQRI